MAPPYQSMASTAQQGQQNALLQQQQQQQQQRDGQSEASHSHSVASGRDVLSSQAGALDDGAAASSLTGMGTATGTAMAPNASSGGWAAGSGLGTTTVKTIQLDGLAATKIIRHCREAYPDLVTGQLLGLDIDGVLEVSNVFSMPSIERHDRLGGAGEDDKSRAKGSKYQNEVLRCLREVNADANIVGWYQSTHLGSFLTQSFIENQAGYQAVLRGKGVVLVHDVSRSTHGNLFLKAFQLSASFLAAHREGKYTTESLIANKVTFSDILEELPVTVRNSHLLTALLSSMTTPTLPRYSLASSTLNRPEDSARRFPRAALEPDFSSLDLTLDPLLEKNLESVLDSIDEYNHEMGNVGYHTRQLAREKTRLEAALAKRKIENQIAVSAGREPVPEDDILRSIKLPADPNRLQSMILSGQLDHFAKTVGELGAQGLIRSFAGKEATAQST